MHTSMSPSSDPSFRVCAPQSASPGQVAAGVAAGGALQGGLAAPFLAAAPASYVHKAFELSRVFLYRWTVNLKFLPEAVFESPRLAAALLAAHLLLLAAFAHWRWAAREDGLLHLCRDFWARGLRNPATAASEAAGASKAASSGADGSCSNGSDGSSSSGEKLRAAEVLRIVFTGNFIGIVCARTLHYQFYSWYFHSLPFLIWCTGLRTRHKLLLWGCIEAVWNVYPSTPPSSAVLLACHCTLLAALWLARPV